jgi:hypothetical protein
MGPNEGALVRSPRARRRGSGVARVGLVVACLAALLAERVDAQGDGTFQQVLALNRTGEWARAAAVARRYLAAPAISPKSPQACLVLEQLVYADTRLGQRDGAKAGLIQFDRDCSDVAIDPGFAAEVVHLRRELAVAVVDSLSADSLRPPVPLAPSADDGFWQVGDPVALGLNTQALQQHRTLCEGTGADACLVVFKGRIVQEWYSPHYQRPIYAMSTHEIDHGAARGPVSRRWADPEPR